MIAERLRLQIGAHAIGVGEQEIAIVGGEARLAALLEDQNAEHARLTGDPAFNSPWSYTGLPSVSFPSAWTPEGLPLGLQVIGKPWSEAELFRVAAWCEDRLGVERRVVG